MDISHCRTLLYSDLLSILQLKERFGKRLVLPKFTSKSFLGRDDEALLQKRRNKLNIYLRQLLKISQVAETPELDDFLKISQNCSLPASRFPLWRASKAAAAVSSSPSDLSPSNQKIYEDPESSSNGVTDSIYLLFPIKHGADPMSSIRDATESGFNEKPASLSLVTDDPGSFPSPPGNPDFSQKQQKRKTIMGFDEDIGEYFGEQMSEIYQYISLGDLRRVQDVVRNTKEEQLVSFINQQTNGKSLIYFAVERRKPEILCYLLSIDADPNLPDHRK